MPPNDPDRDKLVLRVEISPESAGALAAITGSPAKAHLHAVPHEDRELARHTAELKALQELLATERERIERASRELAEREAALVRSTELTASERIRLLGMSYGARTASGEPDARNEHLDEREADLNLREAEFEADVEIREERFERWRTGLTELEEQLRRKEAELAEYVEQLQEEFMRRESASLQNVAAAGR